MSDQLKGVPRGLTVAVVAMGVLLVFGTLALVGAIIFRGHAGGRHVFAASSETSAWDGAPLSLEEPPGSRIVGVSPADGLLAVTVSGGGADRIVLVDPVHHRIAGRILLGH